MRTKVALVINNLSCGGTEKQVVLLSNELVKYLDVYLLLLSAESNEKNYFLSDVSKEVSIVNCTHKIKPLSIFCLIRNAIELNPSFVLTYNLSGNLVGSIFFRIFSKGSIIFANVRGNGRINYKNISIWKNFVDGIITNSAEISERLKNEFNFKKNIKIINNGIVIDKTKNIQQRSSEEELDSLNILLVGRINPVKNFMDILYAAVELKRRALRFKITIVGGIQDSHYHSSLVSFIENHSLEDDIIFMGNQQNTKEFYQSSDLLIITSLTEGFPNVLLEAFSHGIPVISTTVGKVPEIIEDGKNGFLYKVCDHNSLTHLIQNYINLSGDSRALLSQKAKESVDKYDIESIGQDLNYFLINHDQ